MCYMQDKITIACSYCGKFSEAEEVVTLARYKCLNCNCVSEIIDVPIKSWVGFNYADYLEQILAIIKKERFAFLLATTQQELDDGKFSLEQIDGLKAILRKAFTEGKSIRYIVDQIEKKLEVQDLTVRDESGNVKMVIPSDIRAVAIARTETVRTSNLGAIENYKDNNIKQYAWISSVSARTCDQCSELNGQVFDIDSGMHPPAHVACRCATKAITRKA